MTFDPPVTSKYSGKHAPRREWLDRVAADLADALSLCQRLDLPMLALQVEAARTEALMLRGRA